MPRSQIDRLMSVVLASLMLVGLGGTVAGAEATEPEQPAATQTWRTEPGKALKIGGAIVTDQWLVLTDPADDLVSEDGSPVTGAPAAADIKEVWVALGKMSPKLIKAINGGQLQYGRPGNWQGAKFKGVTGEERLFVAIKTHKKANAKTARDKQIVLGFDGDDAVPFKPTVSTGAFAGLETFDIGGGFGKDGWLSGGSTRKGQSTDDDVALFNAPGRGFGGVDKKSGAIFHSVKVPAQADTLSVMLRVGAGDMYDLMVTPDGGAFMGLPGKPWGFNLAANLRKTPPPYYCQRTELDEKVDVLLDSDKGLSGETFSMTSYFGIPRTSTEGDGYYDLAGTTPIRLFPAGSAGDPIVLEGTTELLPGLDAIRVTVVAPEGVWIPEIPYFDQNGDPIRPYGDAQNNPLFSNGGLELADEHFGFVAGDRHCATWNVPDEFCDVFPSPGVAQAVAIVSELQHGAQHIADGSLLCFGVDPATEQAAYIAGLDNDYYTIDDLHRDAEQHRCPYTEVPIGAGGVLFDCRDEGLASFTWVLSRAALQELGKNDAGLRAWVDFNSDFIEDDLFDWESLAPTIDAAQGEVITMVAKYYQPPGQ
jgi:hypothetical protein